MSRPFLFLHLHLWLRLFGFRFWSLLSAIFPCQQYLKLASSRFNDSLRLLFLYTCFSLASLGIYCNITLTDNGQGLHHG